MQERPELETALLAAVVTWSNDAIITKNLDGVVTTWNAAATRMFGYQPEEMIGQPITKIIPVERREEEDLILARLRRGDRVEHFDTVRRRKSGEAVPVSLTISPLVGPQGRILGASKIARDISERKQNEERQRLLANELRHRVKNILSTVRVLASRTFAGPDLETQNAAFSRRIAALAASCDLLVKEDWRGVHLSDVIDAVLEPFRTSEDVFRIDRGFELELSPRQAQSIALACNELATNAIKYGALSRPGGQILLRWAKPDEPERSLVFEWIEHGGPEVVPPKRRGLGTDLLSIALKHELNAETELLFAPEGLQFRMRF